MLIVKQGKKELLVNIKKKTPVITISEPTENQF